MIRPCDMMTVAMARLIHDGDTVFHGVSSHMPMIATLLAEQLLVESGLGTCWSGYFRTAAQNSADIQRRLALPEGHRVYSVLMVGVPAERYPNIPHRPAAQVQWVE